jgi:hypothetical protein
MALAHWQLGNQSGLDDQQQTRHAAEARRWYDQSVGQIDASSDRGSMTDVIREYRIEAAERMGLSKPPTATFVALPHQAILLTHSHGGFPLALVPSQACRAG